MNEFQPTSGMLKSPSWRRFAFGGGGGYHFDELTELLNVYLVCCRQTVKSTNVQWFDPFDGSKYFHNRVEYC